MLPATYVGAEGETVSETKVTRSGRRPTMIKSETRTVDLDAKRTQAVQGKLPTPSESNNLPLQVREANEMLRNVLDGEDPGYEIAFFCECERPDCYAPVWLTSAEYTKRLASGRPIALAGHGEPAWRTDGDMLPAP
jgi:hypothetical protein